MAERIMLLDGNSLINRAYYGLNGRNPLTAPDGTPTGALYAFLNMLLKYIEEIKPSYACAAFDLKEPTFRHKTYEQYKGTRKPMPEDLALQIPLLKELLDQLGIGRYELAGYEADDIIGTLSLQAELNGLDVIMVTGDKDSYQLVSEKAIVMQPVTRGGKTDTKLINLEYIADKYKVKPSQLIDIKAIMGDASDNIPGVKGIGEVGAIKLISEYGSLKNTYDHIDDITSSHAKKLLEHREMAELSHELATICRHVPVPSDIEQWRLLDPAREELYKSFMKYGFRSLIDKFGLGSMHETVKDEQQKTYAEHVEMNSLSDLLNVIKQSIKNSNLRLVISDDETGMILISVYSDGDSVKAQDLLINQTELIKVLTEVEQCGQNNNFSSQKHIQLITYDIKSMMHRLDFGPYRIMAHDIMIAGYLLGQIDGKPDFARLYQSATGQIWENENDGPKQLELDLDNDANKTMPGEADKIDVMTLLRRRNDAYWLTAREQQALFASDTSLDNLMYKVEMPLTSILTSMEKTGFLLDQDELDRLAVEMNKQMLVLQQEIFDLSGEEFNLNSPRQLGTVLFDKLELQTGKKRGGGHYSTNADELERLRNDHPVIEKVIEYRQISKLKSTFVEGLSKSVNERDSRVRTTFSQVQTATGRLSSSDPNLQNIPIRTEAGTKIRKVFIASPGHILLDADYSQIELRLLAHLSQDEAMLEAFNNNQDIHLNTACSIFDLPPEMINSDQRAAAKTVNFSIVYGISDFGLARDLRIPLKKAHEYISGYNARYPRVRNYLDALLQDAKKLGYVETMMGRRRYIPELKSANRNIRMFGERAAMNAPIQGTAADLIKMAMVRVDQELYKAKMQSRLLLQVHDELILEAPEKEADSAARILQNSMEQVIELSVPLIAEVHRGTNWAECK